jgi:L-iditol 2-dehydrogenase
MTTAQRVVAESTGRVKTVTIDVPEPGPGQASVRLTYAGICGSDTHAVAGTHPLLRPPYLPGHEVTGVVEAVGASRDASLVGKRIAIKPNLPCGTCINCRNGRTNACQTLAWIGCDPSGEHPGGMADRFLVPTQSIHLVPPGVSDAQAVLVECFSTPVHATRLAGDLSGARVVVLGGGTIGALQAIAAIRAGAGVVVVSDTEESKRRRALRLGANAAVAADSPTFTEDTLGALNGKADVIFDCVASEASARQWIGVVRRAATVCIVGVPPLDFIVPMPYIQDWEIRVQGCANYNERDFEWAMAHATCIPCDEIVSDIFPISRAAEAFKVASDNRSGKVLLRSARPTDTA